MKCPKCKDRTEVLETVQRGAQTRRRRQCLSPLCGRRFTTTEHIGRHDFAPRGEDDASIKARLIANELRSANVDADVMQAIIATDIRRGRIARAQRLSRRTDASTWYDTGFEAAPDKLDRESLMREMGMY